MSVLSSMARESAAQFVAEKIWQELKDADSPETVRVLKKLGLAVLDGLLDYVPDWARVYYTLFRS